MYLLKEWVSPWFENSENIIALLSNLFNVTLLAYQFSLFNVIYLTLNLCKLVLYKHVFSD